MGTTARGPLTPSPRLTPTPMPSTAASTTATARGALTPSPRPTPTTATVATTATPAPTDTPTTAKCTTKELRSSTGRRDLPTRQYSMKCDETPTITSKLPKKRPSEVRSTKLPFAAVLMMSARKKQKKRKGHLKKKKKKKKS